VTNLLSADCARCDPSAIAIRSGDDRDATSKPSGAGAADPIPDDETAVPIVLASGGLVARSAGRDREQSASLSRPQ
jgi:hypothetical protein